MIARTAVAVAAVGGLVLLGSNALAAPNPPGNNGTVKIHRETGDIALDSNPHNQPHVECPFTVTFFGFDEGDVATVTFTAWAPTGKGKLLLTDTVDIGADDNSGGGSPAGFDGAKTYTLDFDGIVPHEQQGFHVKLRVSVTSPGSKTPKFNKYKVFWAQPCGEEGGTTTTTKPGETTTTSMATTTSKAEATTTTSGQQTTSSSQGGGGASSSMAPSSSAGAGGGVGGGAASSSPSGGGGALAFTGANLLPLLAAAMALLGLGAMTVLASRRRHGGAR